MKKSDNVVVDYRDFLEKILKRQVEKHINADQVTLKYDVKKNIKSIFKRFAKSGKLKLTKNDETVLLSFYKRSSIIETRMEFLTRVGIVAPNRTVLHKQLSEEIIVKYGEPYYPWCLTNS